MKSYIELESVDDIKHELDRMGVDIFEPCSRFEESMSQAMDEFSFFVLNEEKDQCLEILENDINNGGYSVGELQGGSENHSIYRVSFPSEEYEEDYSISKRHQSKNAAIQLLHAFNNCSRKRKFILTIENIRQYMLAMCERRSQKRGGKYVDLGNLMFILQFGGPTSGQLLHIDNMTKNLQICLYMTQNCPSTIVYSMEGEAITNAHSLLLLWRKSHDSIPPLVETILNERSDVNLKNKWYTRYFSFWKTLNYHLKCFGKLYQPVSFQCGLQTDPGTTLIAGGNEVHAGPPTNTSRMFAFAIGIPEDGFDEDDSYGGEDNDGEVQYSSVLLHIDFCCLFFTILDYEYSGLEYQHPVEESKRFLLNILLCLIKDYPVYVYLRQIDNERIELRKWLTSVLDTLENDTITNQLVEEAISSETIFFTPDVVCRRLKKKKRNPKAKHKIKK